MFLKNFKYDILKLMHLLLLKQQVQGIWAPHIETATCTSLNHKYRLIAYGLKKLVIEIVNLIFNYV